MSALDIVKAFEASQIGQFFVTVDPLFVVLFQLLHILGFLLILTSIVLLLLKVLGAFRVSNDPRDLIRWVYRSIALGLGIAILSGAALFLTSATHYFSNAAMPIKLLLLLTASVLSFFLFNRWLLHNTQSKRSEAIATGILVTLWFATGFAGRAIGFV